WERGAGAAASRGGWRPAAVAWSTPRSSATAASTRSAIPATPGASGSSGWRCWSTTWRTSGCFTRTTCASTASSDEPVLMRLSYEWLGEYLDTSGLAPAEAAELLTMTGTKIESVTVVDLSEIIVGRVLEQRDHPRSNKPLWIHQVDVGGGQTRQIVAG